MFDHIDPENNLIYHWRSVGLKLFSRKVSVSLHLDGWQLIWCYLTCILQCASDSFFYHSSLLINLDLVCNYMVATLGFENTYKAQTFNCFSMGLLYISSDPINIYTGSKIYLLS